ncbi:MULTISPECIES: hypothetical protein [unclassified Streptomyces]|uniref:hypothetical protein n=1 Tax=unclassified Streptomyces TaxID=2593676 RepID=UPI002E3031DD|nr:hypothetical protein [Streptomyces sp. NBC_01439]
MSHEAVPETRRHTGPTGPTGRAAQAPRDRAGQDPEAAAQGGDAPNGPLQQMENLMAALNADLSQLDAELQTSTDRTPEG